MALTLDVLYALTYGSVFVGVIYAVVAVGINLLYSTMKTLNIAAGDFLMIGSYLTFTLSAVYGMSPLLSILLVAGFMMVFGVVVESTLLRRIFSTTKNLATIETISVLIFFALVQILDNSANLIWGGQFQSFSYNVSLPILSDSKAFAIVVGLLLIGALYLYMQFTWTGRSIKYVIQNQEAAKIVGVNLRTVYLLVTAISFAFLGAAGTIVSANYTLTPYIGVQYTMDGFVAMVLGGVGNMVLSLPAGIFIGALETFGTYFTSPSLRIVISYVTFLVVLVVRRSGRFLR